MKNLANCNPREFLVQTNKIRKSVANWLEITKIMEIRKQVPSFDDNATEEQKKTAIQEQVKSNIMEILDVVLDEYPNETADLLGLICFIEPNDLENHSMSELMGNISEILNDENVIGFFTSLARLENLNTSGTRRA